MITKNTDGNTISQGFIDEIRSDLPDVTGRLWYNGAELSCDIVSVTVEKGSCGSNPFMIGEVVGDLLTATVKDLNEEIKGKKIEFHVGAMVSGSYEYISLGMFTVSKVVKTRYQSEITAYSGVVADSGGDFDTSNLNSTTIAALAVRLQSDLGCTISFDNGIDTTIEVTETLAGLTDYQVLQVVAVACGGYIVNDIDGNILVKRYDATPTLNVGTGMMTRLPEIAEKHYMVRNIGVLVSDATVDNEGNEVPAVYYTLESQEPVKVIKQGTEYYLIDHDGNYIIAYARPETADVYFQCAYMTQAMFEANIVPVVGYEYYPGTVKLTLGDPRLEGCDVLNVLELDGNYYPVPCHKVVHRYTGGFTTEVRSADASDEENKIGTEYPITQRLQTIDRKTRKAQATAENAYTIAGNTAQYFWFRGTGADTGAHITEVPQEQWDDPNSPYYQSGGNLLARSNGIAVRDGLLELATFGTSGIALRNSDGNERARFNADWLALGDQSGTRVTLNSGSSNPYIYMNANGTQCFRADTTGVRVGDPSGKHSTVDTDGLHVWIGTESTASNEVAVFGSTATIGKSTGSQVVIDNSSVTIKQTSTNLAIKMQAYTADALGGSIVFANNSNVFIHGRTNLPSIGMHLAHSHVNIDTQSNNTEVISLLSGDSYISVQQNGPIVLNANGNTGTVTVAGELKVNKSIKFGAGKSYYLYCRNPGNTADRILAGMGSDGNYFFGYGSYQNSEGAVYFDGNTVHIRSNNTITANKSLSVTGNVTCTGYMKADGLTTTTNSANMHYYTNSSGSLTVGRFYYNAGSSKRFKYDIADLKNKDLLPSRLYDVKVKQFKYNDGYLDKDDLRNGVDVCGFIAEELQKAYPLAVDVDEDGTPMNWNARYIIPPMLALIQEQHEEIEKLKEEVWKLKSA